MLELYHLITFPLLAIGAASYCIPGLVADFRHHPHRRYIAALNLLTGWTVAGWIVALLWAMSGAGDEGPPVYHGPFFFNH